MPDEVPEGRSQDVGGDPEAEGTWWPWPETQGDEPTGPRDGAPGADEALSLPPDGPSMAMPAESAPEAPVPPVTVPEVTVPEVTVPEPEPEPTEPEPTSVVDETRPVEPVRELPAVVGGATTALAQTGQSPWVVPVATDDQGPLNEAIPAVPPKAGTGPIGSIPAAQARAVWSRLQASNWRLFLIRFLSAGLAVVATVVIVPGLGFTGWRWGDFVRIALIFGLLNATVKPLLQFLVLRFIFSTYGIVVVVINALLLLLLGAILNDTFEVYRPVSLVVGGVVVGILGLVLETLLGATPPVLDRDYKERNGVL